MASSTLTIRVDEQDKARLEALARSTGRSRSFLAAEAIAEYLAVNEWQIAGIKAAIDDLDRGEGFEHEAVRKWVEFLGQRQRTRAARRIVRLFWSRRAIGDLRSIQACIGCENPAAAKWMTLRIVEFVETMIPENPAIGRPGRAPETRELVIPETPYIVPCRLRSGAIEGLRVYHGARRWPDRL